jgi:hypothetical protein
VTPTDPIAVAQLVAAVLETVGIPYLIGGSVAASLRGEPRSTLGLDVMIDADVTTIAALVGRLTDQFYVDETSALDAVTRHGSFNAIHIDTSMKVDFFIAEDERFAKDQLRRREKVAIRPGVELYFYTAEDLIVRKLLWFRSGGETSDRQWRDVMGILRVNANLDLPLLRSAADAAGVRDLLERALASLHREV